MERKIQVALGWWRNAKPTYYFSKPEIWDRAFKWVYDNGGFYPGRATNPIVMAQAWRAGYFSAKRTSPKKLKPRTRVEVIHNGK